MLKTAVHLLEVFSRDSEKAPSREHMADKGARLCVSGGRPLPAAGGTAARTRQYFTVMYSETILIVLQAEDVDRVSFFIRKKS